MREYVPDNYDRWEAYETQREMERARRMCCSDCGEPIMSDLCYYINNEYICESCMEDYLVVTPEED